MAPCPTLHCPNKHGLQQGLTPEPGRLCDTCNVTIRPGNDRFACEAWEKAQWCFQNIFLIYTLPETNIAPENQWLENEFH